jgi:hypothetical protein
MAAIVRHYLSGFLQDGAPSAKEKALNMLLERTWTPQEEERFGEIVVEANSSDGQKLHALAFRLRGVDRI